MMLRVATPRPTRANGLAWCATLLAGSWFGAGQPCDAQGEREAAANRLLMGYDAAWATRDIDRLMAPISPTFGCDLYGGVDHSVMRRALESMVNEILCDARCRTRVLRITSLEPTVQAFVTREFRDGHDALLEQQWHVFYLKPESLPGQQDPELKIVALEEFDPDTLGQIAEQKYVGRISGLTFALPKGLFVSLPPCPASVDRVTLRTADLKDEIRIHLRCFADPFDVETRLDTEFRHWKKGRVDADIRVRRPVTLAGARGARIDAHYTGPSCQLQSTASAQRLERTLIRIYVALDPRVLLAIDLDSELAAAKTLEGVLDSITASLVIAEPGGRDKTGASRGYGERLMARLGLGPLPNHRFADADSGLTLSAPPGFALRRVPSENCFALEARSLESPGAEPLSIAIDGIRLCDASLDLEYFATFEDLNFADQCDAAGESRPTIQRVSAKRGELALLRVERAIEGDAAGKDRVELAIYLKLAGHLVVFDTTVPRADRAHAEQALDAMLARLSDH